MSNISSIHWAWASDKNLNSILLELRTTFSKNSDKISEDLFPKITSERTIRLRRGWDDRETFLDTGYAPACINAKFVTRITVKKFLDIFESTYSLQWWKEKEVQFGLVTKYPTSWMDDIESARMREWLEKLSQGWKLTGTSIQSWGKSKSSFLKSQKVKPRVSLLPCNRKQDFFF